MIGARVRVIQKSGPMRNGTVIAESDHSVGVKFDDDPDVPAIVLKRNIGVVL